jgi:hypothetical protein
MIRFKIKIKTFADDDQPRISSRELAAELERFGPVIQTPIQDEEA